LFSSRRRHTISKRDWSSDVCSSDLKCKWLWFHDFHVIHPLILMQFSTISIKMKNPYHSDVIRDTIHYYKINPLMNAKTKNKVAVMTVPLCNTRSIPRAFCLPNNCSAPPDIAPDKPALFPDCN